MKRNDRYNVLVLIGHLTSTLHNKWEITKSTMSGLEGISGKLPASIAKQSLACYAVERICGSSLGLRVSFTSLKR